MFHVKHHHQSGRFAGRPVGRGTAPEPPVDLAQAARSAPRRASTGSAGAKPSSPTRSGGQRSPSGSGGSLTTRTPPTRTRPAAISAVTAGPAKLRAVTRSNALADSGHGRRALGPPLEHLDPVLEAQLARPTPRAPRSADGRDSTRTPRASGQRSASTRPGTPPPGAEVGELAGSRPEHRLRAASANPRRARDGLDRMPGPRNPGACASSRRQDLEELAPRPGPTEAGTHGSAGQITTRRRGSSPSELVSTPVDLGDGVVHDLAVGRAHRLERALLAGLPDLGRDLAGEGGQRLAAALAGSPPTSTRIQALRPPACAAPPRAPAPRSPGGSTPRGPTSSPRPSPSTAPVTSSSSTRCGRCREAHRLDQLRVNFAACSACSSTSTSSTSVSTSTLRPVDLRSRSCGARLEARRHCLDLAAPPAAAPPWPRVRAGDCVAGDRPDESAPAPSGSSPARPGRPRRASAAASRRSPRPPSAALAPRLSLAAAARPALVRTAPALRSAGFSRESGFTRARIRASVRPIPNSPLRGSSIDLVLELVGDDARDGRGRAPWRRRRCAPDLDPLHGQRFRFLRLAAGPRSADGPVRRCRWPRAPGLRPGGRLPSGPPALAVPAVAADPAIAVAGLSPAVLLCRRSCRARGAAGRCARCSRRRSRGLRRR